MSEPEREQEIWQRVAASGQPTEKRRRGITAALERYYQAVGLLRTGRRHGTGDVPEVEPIERINPTD